MKQGDVLNGYRVVSRPTNANAGKCLWAYAEKGGTEFFIKEFLEPKRLREGAMGSQEDQARRRNECLRFEERHRRVAKLLRPDDLHAGNLVLTVDFFAEGTRYYKVTRRVRAAEVAPHELPHRRQLVLLRTLADSLRLLHSHGIVHGDLKPDNVLLHQPPGSDLYVAKLIDFDDAYRAGEAPSRETIGGDPRYGAPEWLRYLRGDPVRLDQAADMFAFGLLAHTYLFGALPRHDERFDEPGSAVAAGAELIFDDRLSGRLADLLVRLTAADPRVRPDIATTADVLSASLASESEPPGEVATRTSRVKVNLGGRTSGRLRINP
ncbi:MAG: protein kinase [Saccharothrix sp.]|nr:protein kinase [Saccharothrix sp.]